MCVSCWGSKMRNGEEWKNGAEAEKCMRVWWECWRKSRQRIFLSLRHCLRRHHRVFSPYNFFLCHDSPFYLSSFRSRFVCFFELFTLSRWGSKRLHSMPMPPNLHMQLSSNEMFLFVCSKLSPMKIFPVFFFRSSYLEHSVVGNFYLLQFSPILCMQN